MHRAAMLQQECVDSVILGNIRSLVQASTSTIRVRKSGCVLVVVYSIDQLPSACSTYDIHHCKIIHVKDDYFYSTQTENKQRMYCLIHDDFITGCHNSESSIFLILFRHDFDTMRDIILIAT